MNVRLFSVSVGWLLGGLCGSVAAEALHSGKTDQAMEIRSLSVNGQPLSLLANRKLRLAPDPRNLAFGFGPVASSERAPLRIRYKLDGYDEGWREVAGDMSMLVRFMDGNQDPVKEIAFRVQGQTERWTGTLETSAFAHRRETVVVPPGAKGFWIAITSAGPPNTVGIYAITNLVVTRLSASNQPPEVLLRWGPDSKCELAGFEWNPADWMRNGLRVGMAKIVPFATQPQIKALVLLDNDPNAHAEWTTRKEAAMPVSPGDRLFMEWDASTNWRSWGAPARPKLRWHSKCRCPSGARLRSGVWRCCSVYPERRALTGMWCRSKCGGNWQRWRASEPWNTSACGLPRTSMMTWAPG